MLMTNTKPTITMTKEEYETLIEFYDYFYKRDIENDEAADVLEMFYNNDSNYYDTTYFFFKIEN